MEITLFDFSRESSAAEWFSINDVVMGGVSTGRMETTVKGTALFAGQVSLENNGGFASVRSAPGEFDLRGMSGIALRVRGDGRRYKLSIKTDAGFDGVLYQAPFETRDDQWQTIVVPFNRFVARFRGRGVPDAPPLDLANVVSLGLLISDKQDGAFRLEIDWIKAVEDGTP